MAIPQFLGADIGTQLSARIRTGRQAESNISQTNLSNKQKRLEIEEYLMNAQRRKAERSLGTATAESGLKQLPDQEKLAMMQMQESLSEEAQLARSMKQKQDMYQSAGDILATANEGNWDKVREILGPMVEDLQLPEVYDEGAVNNAMTGIRDNMAQRREYAKAQAAKADPKRKMATFQAVDKKTGDVSAVSYDPSTDIYNVQIGVDKAGKAITKPHNPATHDLTLKSEQTTKKATELTRASKTSLQKKLLETREQALQLDSLSKNFVQEYMTTYGRITAWTGSKLDHLGDFGRLLDGAQQAAWDMTGSESRSLIDTNAKRSVFITTLNQFFNDYRHDITGAQSSYMELEKLKKAIINEDMPPEELYQNLLAFTQKIQERADRTLRYLEDGIVVVQTWGVDEHGNKFATESHVDLVDTDPKEAKQKEESVKRGKRTERNVGGVKYYVYEQ